MADSKAQQYKGSKTTVRLPLMTSEHINHFTGADISNEGGKLYNCIVDTYASEENRPYVTQRPAINVFDDASETMGVGINGRGITYWSANNSRYFMNNNVVYKGDTSTPCTMQGGDSAIPIGTEKVYFVEWESANSSYLFIIDPENDGIYCINSTANTSLINISNRTPAGTGGGFHGSDSWDFDSLITTMGYGLCHGAVYLDQYLFVGTEDGRIWGSNVGDLLNWDGLNVLTCERENDKLLYIDKSKDHVFGFGERTTEVLYDAGNLTGSPLAPRKDIFYNNGIISGETAWRDGDDIYVIGMKPSGDFELFVVRDFQMEEVSPSTVDSYLKHGRTEATLTPKVSGFSSGHHVYAIITIFDDNNVPQVSLVYDDYPKKWYQWETNLVDNTHFPLISWTIRTPTTPVVAEGILANGDLVKIVDNFVPIDNNATEGSYFLEDYEAEDYDEEVVPPVNSNVNMKILISNYDEDSTDTKFMHSLNYVGNPTITSNDLNVRWSDDSMNTWSAIESIDLATRSSINRLGSFERRAFEIDYSGSEQIRIESIECAITVGNK